MYTEDSGASEHSAPGGQRGGKRVKSQIRDIPIGVLHLGVKTSTLERAGFRTIGDLENTSLDQIMRIPTVGWRTADLLSQNHRALFEAWDDIAGIDWDKYCDSTSMPLLPHGSGPASGEEFLACLPEFLSALADNLADETFTVILRERICQPPGQQKTLDEIAATTDPPVTRERIRQKEKKLLGQLAGGLLNDAYGTLDIHFRPEFTHWWRLAADRLSHLDEVEFGEFVETLSAAWSVPADAVMPHLPAILAIVTGEPQMTGDFRAACRIDPRLFGALSEELLLLPVSRLRIGKYAGHLIDAGIETVGDMISRLRSGSLAIASGKAASVAAGHANLLACCISERGTIDWPSYQEANRLPCLPAFPVYATTEFASGLSAAVEVILTACSVTKRAPDIYRMRTRQPVGSQMTLQAVADELGTHLPTVKREETVFLRFLNDVLIGKNFSMLPVWLDDSWLLRWNEASDAFDLSTKDYLNFSENLAWKWRLTGREISHAAPTIWAVLTGYPADRRSRGTLKKVPEIKELSAPASQLPVGRIRLRGFRRMH